MPQYIIIGRDLKAKEPGRCYLALSENPATDAPKRAEVLGVYEVIMTEDSVQLQPWTSWEKLREHRGRRADLEAELIAEMAGQTRGEV